MQLNLNKIIDNLYYSILLLVPVGWFLNWKYYFSRFESEGFGWIGLIISIALVIFASIIFSMSQFFKQKKQNIWILFFAGYCILALYSINCTAAGQYWDQQVKNQETETEKISKENNSYWINRYEIKIEESEKEIERLNKIRDNSINNLSNMYYYKNTEKTVERRINEEYEKIQSYETELKKLTDKNQISAKNQDNITMSKTLYEFYNKKNPETIQFIFQIILSIIIESIAQLSIFSYMKIKYILNKKENEQEKIIIDRINKNELRHFVVNAWRGIDTKQSKSLTDKKTLLGLMENLCPNFTENKYNKIVKKAVIKGLLKTDKTGLYPASEFITREDFYQKMIKILKLA